MLRLLARIAGVGIAVLALAALAVWWGIGLGGFGSGPRAGRAVERPIPPAVVEARDAAQEAAGRGVGAPAERRILFGDLHVHTTFSADAFLFSLPMLQGEGAHPPADACDFARFCSGLDFWSINDHAELLTPAQWSETVAGIRQCHAVGDGADVVSFLGWEWTQAGATPEAHFGHKNVILRGLGDDEIPARPIGADQGQLAGAFLALPMALRLALPLGDRAGFGEYLEFNHFLGTAAGMPRCPSGVPVRELPLDCFEYAPTPEQLFAKLDDWGHDALVIPHGTSWGIHAPPRSDWAAQLAPGRHDPARQRLIEVYSGHGTSEVTRDWRAVEIDGDGKPACPAPRDGYEPCCWRAGELVRARCGDAPAAECERRVELARRYFAMAGVDPLRFQIAPGATPEEWGECGQLPDGFLPAYAYRPGMAAQTALALGEFSDPVRPGRFRFGLIGSSDNHNARAGTGYKEFAREFMSDAWGARQDVLDRIGPPPERTPEPMSVEMLGEALPPLAMLLPERGASFYYTGGLVAVHATGRDRDAIFDALQRREAYGTSGDRMLLWFDLLEPGGAVRPMGSEVRATGTPRFRVRAVGAFEQQPGCPDHTLDSLSADRIERLCRGECHHPGDVRRLVTRVEVVRIRPQRRPGEAIATLVEDPWRVLSCPLDLAGCTVEFDDPEFAGAGRETLYYVRAYAAPSLAVNGDPLRCQRDAEGRCLRPRPCYASGPRDAADDCLAPIEERAWSSPIFVTPAPR